MQTESRFPHLQKHFICFRAIINNWGKEAAKTLLGFLKPRKEMQRIKHKLKKTNKLQGKIEDLWIAWENKIIITSIFSLPSFAYFCCCCAVSVPKSIKDRRDFSQSSGKPRQPFLSAAG